MHVNIQLDTTEPKDVEILKALVGALNGETPKAQPSSRAKSTTVKTEVPVEEPAAVEPAPVVETKVSGGTVSQAATMKNAVDAATKLVADGKARRVKAALKISGASRVTELTDVKIPVFIENATRFAGMTDDEFEAYEESQKS